MLPVFPSAPRVQSLRVLFNSLLMSLPSLWNIGSLLFVVGYIFAVLGTSRCTPTMGCVVIRRVSLLPKGR
jgi:hypothetical protein